MNTYLKDLNLFEQFKDPNLSIEHGEALYVVKESNGEQFHTTLQQLRGYVSRHFVYSEDPFWANHGNEGLNSEFIEVRSFGDEDYGLVWRDVIILYYKRLGRATYINRTLSSQEIVQFSNEVMEALKSDKRWITQEEMEVIKEKRFANMPDNLNKIFGKMRRNAVSGLGHNNLFGAFNSSDPHKPIASEKLPPYMLPYFDSLSDSGISDTLSNYLEVIHSTERGLKSTSLEDQILDLPCKYKDPFLYGISEKEYFKISELCYAIRETIDKRTTSAFVDMPKRSMQQLFNKAVYSKTNLASKYIAYTCMHNWIKGFVPNYIPRASAAAVFGPTVGPYTKVSSLFLLNYAIV